MLVIAHAAFKDRRGGHLDGILRDRLGSSLAGIEYIHAAGEGARLAYKAAQSKLDTVVAVGGDGTINEAVNGLVGSDTALGVIPAGTANDLAALCRIPADPHLSCGIIRAGKTARVDVVGVNGKYYVTTGGIGVPAEVVKAANSAKTRGGCARCLADALGAGIYLFGAAAALGKRAADQPPVTVRWDGKILRTKALSLMFNNQAFCARRFLMSPKAANSDGLGDVCLIEEPGGRLPRLLLLPRVMRGSHVRLPWVKAWRTRSIVIESEIPLDYMGDGELLATERIFFLKIHPAALKVIVPDPRRFDWTLFGRSAEGRHGAHEPNCSACSAPF